MASTHRDAARMAWTSDEPWHGPRAVHDSTEIVPLKLLPDRRDQRGTPA